MNTSKPSARATATSVMPAWSARLLNDDAFGAGWMLIVRAAHAKWRERLTTGPALASAFAAWIAAETYKDRVE